MSAGSNIVQMRDTARALLPYLNHLDTCDTHDNPTYRCSCKFLTVVERAKRLANVDLFRT